MYFNCFETQVRPGPGGGGQILFKPPYRSVLMGGSRGGGGQENHKLYGIYHKR